jgi:hypothetical protein
MHPLPPGPGYYFLSAQCTFFPAPGKPTRRVNRINSVPDALHACDDTCGLPVFSVSAGVRKSGTDQSIPKISAIGLSAVAPVGR